MSIKFLYKLNNFHRWDFSFFAGFVEGKWEKRFKLFKLIFNFRETQKSEKMKTFLIIALALVAAAYAYEVDDIPEFMRERLDKFVELRKKWEQKWLEMTPEERDFFEKMIYSRLSHIPDSVKSRIHTKIEGMESEDRSKLKNYLYQRFTELKQVEADNEVEELDGIIEQLPELIREKISDFIAIRFAPAAAYQSVIFLSFLLFECWVNNFYF